MCFRNKLQGEWLGMLRKRRGYTILKQLVAEVTIFLQLIFRKSSVNRAQIWLHHLWLGHPSFSVLKTMFALLFQGLDINDFQCDVCQLAKHHRVSFPLYNTKSSTSFCLIHTDVWGLFLITNINGVQWFVSLVNDCSKIA